MSWFKKSEDKEPATANPFSVYRVLRDLVRHMQDIRAEVRQLRKQNEEVKMSIDALKANVVALIDLAEKAKTAAEAVVAAPAVNPDQAAVDDLNNQVVAAINVLTPPVVAVAAAAGTPAPTPPVTPAPAATDPNAPVA